MLETIKNNGAKLNSLNFCLHGWLMEQFKEEVNKLFVFIRLCFVLVVCLAKAEPFIKWSPQNKNRRLVFWSSFELMLL